MTIQEISTLLEGKTETLRANLIQDLQKKESTSSRLQEHANGQAEPAARFNPIQAAQEASRIRLNKRMLEEVAL
ncbi:hypothetical protein V9K67_00855 [Paraflavisolibacter sp. H34]|uniref:hypothetical protein n=1 Tax=Huijunlia imazamoxiresistens TaxID=3127457 RepID=UPI0030160158